MWIVILYRKGYFLDSIEEGFYGPFESERDAYEYACRKMSEDKSYRIIELSK